MGHSAIVGNTVPMVYRPIGSSHLGNGKAPACPLYIDIDDNVITMTATSDTYTVSLYNETDVVVYSIVIPEGTTQIVLPTALSGNFKIIFEAETYYYYGYIDL